MFNKQSSQDYNFCVNQAFYFSVGGSVNQAFYFSVGGSTCSRGTIQQMMQASVRQVLNDLWVL
jgi:hypothetical protein